MRFAKVCARLSSVTDSAAFLDAASIARGTPGLRATDLIGTDRRFSHDADNPGAGFSGRAELGGRARVAAEGWNFGGHTATRARLVACAPPVLEREVVAPLEALQRELGISPPTNSQVGVGFGMTRDNGWIRVRIDHILTGAQWRETGRRGPLVGRTHGPVIADLIWQDSQKGPVNDAAASPVRRLR